jgi:hypothetical protein
VKSPIEVEVVVHVDSEVVGSCSTIFIRTERSSCGALNKLPKSGGTTAQGRRSVFLDPQSIVEVQVEPDALGN